VSGDVVALCRQQPDVAAQLSALLAAGPRLRMRPFGPVLQLFDDDGQRVASVDGPLLVQVPGEVARLLGPDLGVTEPVWWVEIRAATDSPEAERLARQVAEHLAGEQDGVVWPAP
jgi:hypothetical protein